MKIALEVWSSNYTEVEQTCVAAESLGLDGFYYGESPHGLNLDCWTTLAGLARTTERIRLGPVITNVLPTYRSTVLLARQASTVDRMSSGRVDLRTGVGAAAPFGRPWWEPYGVEYPPYGRRLADLESALERLPALLADGMSAVPNEARPSIPITIAAKGERAMHLAVACADVWETSFCTPSEFAEQATRMASFGAPATLRRSLEIDGFVSLTDEGARRMLDRARSERGAFEDLEPVFERALVGTPDQVAERLHALDEAGVDQVVVALHDPHDPDALEAVAAARNRLV